MPGGGVCRAGGVSVNLVRLKGLPPS
jgi:hypothetical protein